jgi:predicted secreted protein
MSQYRVNKKTYVIGHSKVKVYFLVYVTVLCQLCGICTSKKDDNSECCIGILNSLWPHVTRVMFVENSMEYRLYTAFYNLKFSMKYKCDITILAYTVRYQFLGNCTCEPPTYTEFYEYEFLGIL